MNDDQKAAILRAADWLEANPDKHIQGDLATDLRGKHCLPTAATAACFCALGRIAKEAGIEIVDNAGISSFRQVTDAIGLPEMDPYEIYSVNDDFAHRHDRESAAPLTILGDQRGSPEVITLLRKLAA